MKLKTKAIENYMALGGSLPPLSPRLYFPAWCACPWSLMSQSLALAPHFGGLLGPVPHTQGPLDHLRLFLVFLSVLEAGGRDIIP